MPAGNSAGRVPLDRLVHPFRQSRLQRLVAGLVLAAFGATLAPATAARSAREARLDAVLGHPEAVRVALSAADAASTPEAAVGLFVDAYRAATGEPVAADAIASAVADLLLGRSFRPVPPPETRVSTAGPSPASTPSLASTGLPVGAFRLPVPSRASALAARATSTPARPDAAHAPPARAP